MISVKKNWRLVILLCRMSLSESWFMIYLCFIRSPIKYLLCQQSKLEICSGSLHKPDHRYVEWKQMVCLILSLSHKMLGPWMTWSSWCPEAWLHWRLQPFALIGAHLTLSLAEKSKGSVVIQVGSPLSFSWCPCRHTIKTTMPTFWPLPLQWLSLHNAPGKRILKILNSAPTSVLNELLLMLKHRPLVLHLHHTKSCMFQRDHLLFFYGVWAQPRVVLHAKNSGVSIK